MDMHVDDAGTVLYVRKRGNRAAFLQRSFPFLESSRIPVHSLGKGESNASRHRCSCRVDTCRDT